MNSFGRLLKVTTFGESHGPAIGCVLDGFPAGMTIDLDAMRHELSRRATGKSRHTSQRREADDVQVLSGTFEGVTTGTPIALLIENTDAKSKDYSNIAQQFRPGHADYTYFMKYGRRDYRGGGRSSARETTMRVAAGALAKQWLRAHYGTTVRGYLAELGPIAAQTVDWSVIEDNPFFCPQADLVPLLESFMDRLRKSGDSVGARINVVARPMPVGLGEPVYHKLDTTVAAALMSINAVKGVEIGAGFASVAQRGTRHRDEMTPDGFLSNEAGGTLGGISSGQDLLASLAIKPTSSLRLPGQTVDERRAPVAIVTKGRHDPCVGIRATPIAEAMVALTLMDLALQQRALNGDQQPNFTPLAAAAPQADQPVERVWTTRGEVDAEAAVEAWFSV